MVEIAHLSASLVDRTETVAVLTHSISLSPSKLLSSFLVLRHKLQPATMQHFAASFQNVSPELLV